MSSFYGEQAVKATQTMVAEGDYTHVAGSDIMKPRKDYNEVLALAYRKQNKINVSLAQPLRGRCLSDSVFLVA